MSQATKPRLPNFVSFPHARQLCSTNTMALQVFGRPFLSLGSKLVSPESHATRGLMARQNNQQISNKTQSRGDRGILATQQQLQQATDRQRQTEGEQMCDYCKRMSIEKYSCMKTTLDSRTRCARDGQRDAWLTSMYTRPFLHIPPRPPTVLTGPGSLAVRGTGSGGRRQLQNMTLGLPPNLTRTAPNRISREQFLGFWATGKHDVSAREASRWLTQCHSQQGGGGGGNAASQGL